MNALPAFLNDVEVSQGPVPSALDGATTRGVLWAAGPGRFQLEIPGLARYRVEAGRSVRIESLGAASESDLLRGLRMTPLAALLYQRGLLGFQGAVAANARGAVLVAGPSGVGKSALVAALGQRGWSLLADGVAPVACTDRGEVLAMPTFPELALWPDSLAALGWAPGEGPGRHHRIGSGPFASGPVPLRAIVALSSDGGEDVRFQPMAAGAQRFQALAGLTYNSRIHDALADRGQFLGTAAAVLARVALHTLVRPRHRWTAPELADCLEGDGG